MSRIYIFNQNSHVGSLEDADLPPNSNTVPAALSLHRDRISGSSWSGTGNSQHAESRGRTSIGSAGSSGRERSTGVSGGSILPTPAVLPMLAWMDCWVEPPQAFAAATEGRLGPVADNGVVELGRILMPAHGSSMTGVKSVAIVVNPPSKSVLPTLNGSRGTGVA